MFYYTYTTKTRKINKLMSTEIEIHTFVNNNVLLLNNIQAYHWQTKSYSEHEALGTFYKSFNDLNDRFVETWQGKTNERISFSAEYKPNIKNYSGKNVIVSEMNELIDHINYTSQKLEGHIDMQSILEDMLETSNQLLYHLTLN